jgi:hypothetical protein
MMNVDGSGRGMKSEIFKGQLREILNMAGAAFITFGIATGEQVAAGSGLVLSVAVLIWALRENVGREKILSLTRKVFGAVGTMIVVLEVLSPEKTGALIAVVGPLLAMFLSFWQHGGKLDGGKLGLLVVSVLALSFFPSCAISEGLKIRGPVSGLTYAQGPDGIEVTADEETVSWWRELVFRVSSGEKIGDVLRDSGK